MASAYLTRTVTASTATSYTVSFWVKINDVNNSNTPYFWSIGSSAGNGIYFDTDGKIDFFRQSDTSYLTLYDGVLRDPSAWYHIVWSVNAGTGTAYVNGVTGNSHSSIPALNDNTGTKIAIHDYVGGSYNSLDCCMTHFHFIDGTAYNADTFGEIDSTSGIWKPKTSPSVTYGTNGFFLKMENSSDMGEDSSGNNNDFTTSGTITQTEDTPSNNFATLNALYFSASGLTISNGNLSITGNSSSAWRSLPATLGVSSGKWYYEAKIKSFNTGLHLGIIDYSQVPNSNAYAYQYSRAYMYKDDGNKANNNTSSSYGNSFTTGDIIGVAMDLDNNKIYFSKNGTFQNSGDPTSGATGTGSAFDITSGYDYTPVFSTYNTSDQIEFNFGNGRFGTTAVASSNSDSAGLGLFEYSVPSGYYALCTKNIKNYG